MPLDLGLAELLVRVAALVIGLTVHEFAHAWTAFRLGDLTAYLQGRLTLDPRRHIDPFGALMMMVAGFGWARPVPIDPGRLGRRGVVQVSLAGPLSNLVLAFAAVSIIRVTALGSVSPYAAGLTGGVYRFVEGFAWINIVLAVFNMLPIPPLDGWKVLLGVVPDRTGWRLRQYEPYGVLALLLVVFLGGPVLQRLFSGVGMLFVDLVGTLWRTVGL